MTRFEFRLQTLLKLRESLRQQRRQELAEAHRVEDLLQQQIDQVESQQEETRKRSKVAASPGMISVSRLLDTHRYEILLQARIQQLLAQQNQLREEIERRRQALMAADQDVRILEKLREKQESAHRWEEDRRDVKELDEIAQRHVRSGQP
jgi:flagellar export protein FliJ